MKKIYLFSVILLFASNFLYSQIAINSDGSAPDPSAGLDISYTNKGVLLPRLTFDQRNAINNPAEGLIIFCTNCSSDATGGLSIFEGGEWKSLDLKCATPNIPVATNQVATETQITWNWNLAPIALGYKWNTTNDQGTATDIGIITTITETNLSCNTTYTRYLWAYNNCGLSPALILTQSTLQIPINQAPTAGVHQATLTSITWNWNGLAEASGYKWNTTNDYSTAVDMGNSTSITENGLTCGTSYTRYIWGYNNCGVTPSATLTKSTSSAASNAPVAATHVPSSSEIVWNWHPVFEATGYKWNNVNNYATATDLGTDTTYTESGLSCFTPYTCYVWTYNGCAVSVSAVLTQSTSPDAHPAPTAAVNVPAAQQIVWKWHPVPEQSSYKWNTVNNYATATNVGSDTTFTENGLLCNTSYVRFIWAYDNCAVSTVVSLSGLTTMSPPVPPTAGTHVPSPTQIVWNWNTVQGASGYKWNTTNDYNTAIDIGAGTSKTETGLTCNTSYSRFVWAYSNCGVSTSATLTQTSSLDPPAQPVAGTHVASPTQIVWNWNTVAGATGYKWNTTNNFATATDLGNITTKTETGLTCNTSYTRYVWAYSNCGTSTSRSLVKSTTDDSPIAPVTGTHVATPSQITWNWNTVAGASGYKWNTVNNYATATDMGTGTSKTETGLSCNTSYTRYVWAYNYCGNSVATTISQATPHDAPGLPVAATSVADVTQITWKWHHVDGATGYKWNTTNTYATATDVGTDTVKTETGLTCNTAYSRYVWAYNPCDPSAPTTLSWSTAINPPGQPVAGTHVPAINQIIWNWNAVADATGYKWNTTNNLATAIDMGTATSRTESGLNCNTSYTRYVWAYGTCGTSTQTSLVQATTSNPPASPTAGTHTSTASQIVWNWNTVTGATGYKWNTTNNYATATDMGLNTTKTENGLNCNTSYTRYCWAYTSCGNSTSVPLNQSTTACAECGTSITVNHVAGAVAPVSKSVTYGIVTSIPGEPTKCWISSNLGADHQATTKTDATEASAGWYWQFNRMQGFKHDGTTRTPNTTWINLIDEYSNWTAANDPCTIELGSPWRLPTAIEWTNVDAAGLWTNWDGPWNSALKIHVAGRLYYSDGTLNYRGSQGAYWSGSQANLTLGQGLYIMSSLSNVSQYNKTMGYSVRCIKE